MTDPTHTTNEQIALKLGWKRAKLEGAQVWFLPLKAGPQGELPDFEHDWAHNGLLQDELWAAGFELSHDVKDGTFYWWRMGEDGPEPLDDDREDTTDLKVATALDWLAWKKEGKLMDFIETFKSSNIARFCYDKNSQVLQIEFKKSGPCRFFDVPEAVFERMKSAESKGQFFGQNIRGIYRYAYGGPKLSEVAHQGDPCKYCGVPHDDVEVGPCVARVKAHPND